MQLPNPTQTSAEYQWWGQSCPLEVLAGTLRGRPEQRAALIHLASVWLQHRDRCCTATRPA